MTRIEGCPPAAGGVHRAEAVEPATFLDVEVRRVDHYRIQIERGLVGRLGQALTPLLRRLDSGAVHLVTDGPVAERYADAALAGIESHGVPVRLTVLPPGEATKAPRYLLRIWRQLHQEGAHRRDLLVALGGGVICDLVGMAAATFMRGMPYVNVPTTLLAQVDAAIGGKVGADFAGVKNLVGAFHQPSAVLIDPGVLATLPRRHLVNGFAEVVKVALIADPELYALLEHHGPGLLDPRHPALVQVTHRSAQLKVELLSTDPFETGTLARPLNLGHCFGHPLEAASGFRMPHGHAVARGIAVAAALGQRRGLCSAPQLAAILRTLRLFELPTDVPPPLLSPAWRNLETIRRVRNGELRPVIPVAPGRLHIGSDVTGAEWTEVAQVLSGGRRPHREGGPA